VETFNNEKLMDAFDNIPFTFIGKYRTTMRFEFVAGNDVHIDCCRLPSEVMDA
jgi:hypothetical protein